MEVPQRRRPHARLPSPLSFRKALWKRSFHPWHLYPPSAPLDMLRGESGRRVRRRARVTTCNDKVGIPKEPCRPPQGWSRQRGRMSRRCVSTGAFDIDPLPRESVIGYAENDRAWICELSLYNRSALWAHRWCGLETVYHSILISFPLDATRRLIFLRHHPGRETTKAVAR